jgi:tRNA(His) guanylyltransferase
LSRLRRSLRLRNISEFLFQHGVNFNDVPSWQKRGIGLYWETYDKHSVNPLTGEEVVAARLRIKVDYELPMKYQYGEFILRLIEDSVESE